MARTKNPVPHAARTAADAATDPAPAPVAVAAADNPAAAVLVALSAEPAGAAVTVIAARAGISAAARQALLAHEKNGTATRVKGSRPGIADTWTPAAARRAPRCERLRRRAACRRAGRQHRRRDPARPGPRVSCPTRTFLWTPDEGGRLLPQAPLALRGGGNVVDGCYGVAVGERGPAWRCVWWRMARGTRPGAFGTSTCEPWRR
jgi:hypothetical protein